MENFYGYSLYSTVLDNWQKNVHLVLVNCQESFNLWPKNSVVTTVRFIDLERCSRKSKIEQQLICSIYNTKTKAHN